ncbi:poly A polymerase C-terminal region-like protein [Delitschia confertaspora ATCC 74209]|uniref:Poly A polymerase C-terminal region-like protein n=1 Tax=Delitschia confertaspora ATCC 74209 TaxID=1513339 RepID=A0A9P4MTY4_9PLEO|nr:poly A polymerase C-terminal region-like protein [Delitschia confertaspora ATCC 74209]
MAEKGGSNSNPTTLELTEVETNLRKLLLDVAAFIDNTSVPEPADVKVPDELTKEKTVLRFTGGWVRDKLLHVGSHDIDVAINKMTGLQFGLKLNEYLEMPGNPEKYGLAQKEENTKSNGNSKGRKVASGMHKIEANPEKSKHLETVTTKILGLDIDLVNLRKETYSEDSRNPQMEFGTPEEDAMRRDATVNAMFYNLNTCQIEDFTGRGFDDMKLKIIRTPLEPYQTFKDDPLRVLRLIRFASRLGYKIDPEAEKAMEHPDIKEALKLKISRERVGIETEKMLKGPDPHMALSLIDRIGLYETVFTDPTRDIDYSPDIKHLKTAYDLVTKLASVSKETSPLAEIPKALMRDSEENYLAWICAAMMPWADAPMPSPPKPTARPQYIAQLVAREGIKAPNKVSDVIAASLRFAEEIRTVKDACYERIKYPHRKNTREEAIARDTLGMAIRRWGSTWRTQVLFSLLHEICLGQISRDTTLNSYSTFLSHLTSLDILEAYNFKPLLTGKELAKALNSTPGPWMKDALDVVMAWQLQHPNITDPAGAIEAVKAKTKISENGKEKEHCELPARLAAHFLRSTIRPLFSPTSQKTAHPNLTAAGNRVSWPAESHSKARATDDPSATPWKDPKQAFVVDLLRWTLSVLEAKEIETNWGLLVPPILKMTDDIEIKWKATGCKLLTLLLESTPLALLSRTGLGDVFEETIFPMFTYLPPLTPEQDSIMLVEGAFPAIMALADVLHPPIPKGADPLSPDARKREKFLDKILQASIVAPLFRAEPSSYPALATAILSHLPPLLQIMGIDSVKHLQSLIPLLSDILAEPLGPAYPALLSASAKGMQSVILNGWPRVGGHRGDVLRGVCVGWIRIIEEVEGKRLEEGDERAEGLEGAKGELSEVCRMLEAVLRNDEGVDWKGEKEGLERVYERLRGLFGGENGDYVER